MKKITKDYSTTGEPNRDHRITRSKRESKTKKETLEAELPQKTEFVQKPNPNRKKMTC